MAEGLLNLLELAGPEQVIAELTRQAGGDALEFVEVVSQSGHPAEVGMDEWRRLVAEPMRARGRPLRMVGGSTPGGMGRRAGARRRRK